MQKSPSYRLKGLLPLADPCDAPKKITKPADAYFASGKVFVTFLLRFAVLSHNQPGTDGTIVRLDFGSPKIK